VANKSGQGFKIHLVAIEILEMTEKKRKDFSGEQNTKVALAAVDATIF
jgi:hypothetical protein